jgi:hypothetical protein
MHLYPADDVAKPFDANYFDLKKSARGGLTDRGR